MIKITCVALIVGLLSISVGCGGSGGGTIANNSNTSNVTTPSPTPIPVPTPPSTPTAYSTYDITYSNLHNTFEYTNSVGSITATKKKLDGQTYVQVVISNGLNTVTTMSIPYVLGESNVGVFPAFNVHFSPYGQDPTQVQYTSIAGYVEVTDITNNVMSGNLIVVLTSNQSDYSFDMNGQFSLVVN